MVSSLDLTGEDGDAYIRYHARDVGEDLGAIGTVILRIKKVPVEKSIQDEFYEKLSRDKSGGERKEGACGLVQFSQKKVESRIEATVSII